MFCSSRSVFRPPVLLVSLALTAACSESEAPIWGSSSASASASANESPAPASESPAPPSGAPPAAGSPPAPQQAPPSDAPPGVSTLPLPGDQHFDFDEILARGREVRPIAAMRQRATLAARYDLSDRPSDVLMTRGKPVQEGVRVLLPEGVTFDLLASLSPAEIRARDIFPLGFLPLPHPNHTEGGMIFPRSTIDDVKRQTGRDLERFDLDFDLPEHLIPEFPPAIFLTTRPDLGDVSKGQLVTSHNFFELFKDILNPKQLDGLRLLLFPFAQQQFNLTDDRRSLLPSFGVACFDCHINGHTNAATHLVGDIRPGPMRNRIDTPPLRGVHLQRLFGSQRALRSVEDFTEFEQRAAYFDGDPVSAQKKGVNILDRGAQVHPMAEMQALFDFPPAPKLDLYGRLDQQAEGVTLSEVRGEAIFFGKGRCSECHPPPFYSDNQMHDLRVDRFFTHRMINGNQTKPDGPIKTFPLRGIKESPTYFHDGRLITLEDTIEFFNLVLGTRLSAAEKRDLLAFLLVL
jgi:cytochrome c peroxidase